MTIPVLLTHGYFIQDDAKESQVMKPYPPLGILYLSAFLDSKGIENVVFDTTFSSVEEQKKCILEHKPAVLGVYANLMTKKQIVGLIRWVIGEPQLTSTRIVIGGPDARYNRNHWLDIGAHFVLSGEGEVAFYSLVSAILMKAPISEVPSLSYLQGGKLIDTSAAAFLPMDDLPVPARHKINLNKYLDVWRKHHGYATISVSTMRGCPYTCKWCSRAVYGQSYRRRSPEKVVDELATLIHTYGVTSFWFVDDVFTVSHKWMKAFAEQITSRKMDIRYECITRADRMNTEVIEYLKKSGCFRVWIGAESGSQRVIDLMDRRVDTSKVREMIRETKAHGMEAGTFIMLGYPGETDEDIHETAQHLKDSLPDYFTITTAYPIRGTELYTENTAMIDESASWSETTDREIHIKRPYPDKYYYYAIRYINNTVLAERMRKRTKTINPILYGKIYTSMMLMYLYRKLLW
ncbi:MAG: B12-binding domain-containing radical SAM protein [Bacteroidota bacterium]|jgi:anaerobic magnesium-protoporphyrin IX monomethyl ester cyclase